MKRLLNRMRSANLPGWRRDGAAPGSKARPLAKPAPSAGQRALVGLLILALLPGGAPVWGDRPAPAASAGEKVKIARHTLTRKIFLTGEVQAEKAATVHAPATRAWGLLLSFLVPDGSLVKEGDVVARFDSSRLELDRLDLEKQREEAKVRIAQKESEIETRRQDLLLRQAGARKTLDVARLYAGIERSLIPRSESEKYAFDLSNAQTEMDKAGEALANLDKVARDELEVIRLAYDQADLSLKQILTEIDSMTLKAPASGLIMVARNWDSNRPYQIGDKVFNGQPVLSIPDLSTLRVEADVHDADVMELKQGMSARITLDSQPERQFSGRLGFMTEASKVRDGKSKLKLFRLFVSLDNVNPTVMKPGMTARVEVAATRLALAVPRSAVRLGCTGEASLLLEGRPKESPLTIVDTDDQWVAIAGDFREGDTVLLPSGSDVLAAQAAVEWIDIKKQDIQFTVNGTGAIQAAKSANVGPPALPHIWEYKIIRMAEEGSQVKVGDFLLQFDPTEVMRRLQDEQADLEKASREIQRTEASNGIKVKDLELELEDAKAQRERTAGKLKDVSQFESAIKVKEAEFEAELAKVRARLLEEKLAFIRKTAGFEMKLLKETELFHQERVRNYMQAMQAMTVNAAVGGVVLYATGWRNTKKKIGDTVWLMENILFIPDLNTLLVRGEISEVDSGKVRVGQTVTVSLDAIQERVFQGKIVHVADMFTQTTADIPVKVMEVEIRLDAPDLVRMRPGMAAKLEIVHDVFKNVLAVPLSSVLEEGGRSYVWVRVEGKPEKREVKVGRNNGVIAIVESGLKDGDKVADRPLKS